MKVKKNYIICICALILILGSLALVYTRNTKEKEEKLIMNFITSYYTDPSNEIQKYKKYFTKDVYNYAKTTNYVPWRNSHLAPINHTNIENIEITKIAIEQNSDESTNTTHYYNVSFTLKNKVTSKEMNIPLYKVYLEKEGLKWKICNKTQIDDLSTFLCKI